MKNVGRLVDAGLLKKNGNRVKDAGKFLIYNMREL